MHTNNTKSTTQRLLSFLQLRRALQLHTLSVHQIPCKYQTRLNTNTTREITQSLQLRGPLMTRHNLQRKACQYIHPGHRDRPVQFPSKDLITTSVNMGVEERTCENSANAGSESIGT